jgi:hypothetical protein
MSVRAHPTAQSTPDRCRVLYFSRIDFPSAKANSIQTMNTCWEMARAGAEVHLVVRRLLQSRRDCFAYYGLPEIPRLRFVSLSLPVQAEFNDWQGRTFRYYLAAFLRRHRRGTTFLMSRDAAGLELLRTVASLRPAAGVQTLFEIHKLAFMTKASHSRNAAVRWTTRRCAPKWKSAGGSRQKSIPGPMVWCAPPRARARFSIATSPTTRRRAWCRTARASGSMLPARRASWPRSRMRGVTSTFSTSASSTAGRVSMGWSHLWRICQGGV